MAPFAKAILEVGQSPMKFFPQINNEDAHNIQTHNVDMALLVSGRFNFMSMTATNTMYFELLTFSCMLFVSLGY